MCCFCDDNGMERRDFLKTMGVVTAGLSVAPGQVFANLRSGKSTSHGGKAVVYGAFIYPPSKDLQEEGYYSWPGSGFDAEGRQEQYTKQLRSIEVSLGIDLQIQATPLNTETEVDGFIRMVKQKKPDGLLLIPFKKGHWHHVLHIIDETKIPSIVLATIGVLLMPSIREIKDRPGVYMISSLDNLDAVENGLKLIQSGGRMKRSRILNITGSESYSARVPFLGTTVVTIPHQRFYDAFKNTGIDSKVMQLAGQYEKEALEIVEPDKKDIVEAARCYFAFKKILSEEKGDALMMNCLPGLKHPHQHVPPCMAFMHLRNEGVPMGCESDLDATLTMLLQQYLFDRPGFQHNPAADTVNNLYFGAHCTAPTRMMGKDQEPESYRLRNHAEAGWGVVPDVQFRENQEITIAKYLSSKNGEKAQLLLYSGETRPCPASPRAGGCRTNIQATINELEDVAQLRGHHLCLVYGNFVKELKTFSQLYDIDVVV